MTESSPPKLAILLTLLASSLLALGAVTLEHYKPLPNAIPIITHKQPTIGYTKAPIKIVVFEEPKCSHCMEFTKTILPQIKKEFIDNNKAQLSVIPVSFLHGSMPAAVALLCVYNQNVEAPNSELFMKYLETLYKYQENIKGDFATPETLVNLAKATSPAINTDTLKSCIEKERYRSEIFRNTAYGNKLMGQITTPTVYINGIKVETLSYPELKNLIEQVIEQGEKK
jgi:protein-disulfide isomerase